MTAVPLTVIGIGQDGPAGLSQEALQHVAQAQVLAGGKRHLAFFPDWCGETFIIDADLERLARQLLAVYQHTKTVVLASGDPLFYGIGRFLTEHFPAEDLVFLPHVSSVQLAFARLKTSWHDAQVVSLHGRPLQTLLPVLHSAATKIAILTDATNHPAAIARFLREQQQEHYTMWVCEELGGAGERLSQWTLHDVLKQSFSPLNVTILLQQQAAPTTLPRLPVVGLPEESIAHRAGMITKRDIRLLTLGYLQLHPGEVLWDIGAGSGSVALEAARLCASLRVFAIERSAQAIEQIKQNCQTFALTNVQPIVGEAPEACATLPDPDVVFIGGSGGRLTAIMTALAERLPCGGRLVMNCITLEHFAAGWDLLQRHPWQAEATSVQLAHTKPLSTLHRFEADSPLFILRAHKV
jgi:precorrin-6B C5,15-methyltransferase / cobalt-precorrin-6B C5,C15-methyltransferase